MPEAPAYDDVTVEELKEAAREREVEGFSSMNKAELYDAVYGGEPADQPAAPTGEEPEQGDAEVRVESGSADVTIETD